MKDNDSKFAFIRVHKSTKEAFDFYKKEMTANDYLRSMIDFFLKNNISPNSTEPFMGANILNRVEYMIKKMGGIEKKLVGMLNEHGNMLNAIGILQQNADDNKSIGNGITQGELKKMALENDRLKGMLSSLQQRLQDEIAKNGNEKPVNLSQNQVQKMPNKTREKVLNKVDEIKIYVEEVLRMEKFDSNHDGIIRFPIQNIPTFINGISKRREEIAKMFDS